MNKSLDERLVKRITSFEPKERIINMNELDKMAPEDMTSKEYYLDSTAHFAVHEVCSKKKR